MKTHVMLLTVLTLSGCAPLPPQSGIADQGGQIAWPPPPQAARIRYAMTVSVPADLGIRPSALQRLLAVVTGDEKEDGMGRPYAVAAGRGLLVVGDPGLPAVHLFDLEAGDYRRIYVAGEAVLGSPVGVALGDGRIYVTDSSRASVFILEGEGQTIGVIEGMMRPTGIAFDAAGKRLFVADTLGHRVVAFDPDGRKLFEFGQRGTDAGEFNFPSHLWFADGRLMVNDSMNFRIQSFDSEGRFLAAFGSQGDGSGFFSQPKGVAVDADGHVYVAEATIDRVQIFTPEGIFLMAFGREGSGRGEFRMPAGLAIDGNRIYVADSLNGKIQVFDYVSQD